MRTLLSVARDLRDYGLVNENGFILRAARDIEEIAYQLHKAIDSLQAGASDMKEEENNDGEGQGGNQEGHTGNGGRDDDVVREGDSSEARQETRGTCAADAGCGQSQD